jgi:pimeloyl-ACP methyl ester carboxylesterase
MNWFFALAALSFCTQISTAHADPKFILHQQMLKIAAAKLGLERADKAGSSTFTRQLNQILDHFAGTGSPAAGKTFKQNYYVDSTFAKGPNSPVIFSLCGEGPCSPSDATGIPEINTLAQKYGAYRVSLEHRYYGTSQPFNNLESQNLVYLSMDQAIEDLAYFQRSLQSAMKLTGKWIVVGGSYSGELSAFYRLKHPELVVGSLASSAPVLAKADFLEYDAYVAGVLNSSCLAAVKNVVSDIEQKLQNPTTAAQVKTAFGASEIVDNVDFLYVVADMAAMAVQYGSQDEFCNAILNPGPSTPTEAYGTVGQKVFKDLFNLTPLDDSFQGAMNTSATSGLIGQRAWNYQSCTEFGYYQIANPDAAHSARSQQITLQFQNEECTKMFGLNSMVDTAATNAKFFNQLSNKNVTNIFFTNGSNDPWSTLSLTDQSATASANPALKFFTILDASHCEDLGNTASNALAQARNEFVALASQWLSSN